MNGLVLSIFPGIDLFGRAFEEEGWCVVRGPDLLWGGDIRTFHPPAGVFDGVIGGPPCQCFSPLKRLNPLAGRKHGNLIPEFERVVEEARPRWFVMENVPEAPVPQVRGYWPTYAAILDPRWIGEEQQRRRRFSFATRYDVTPSGIKLDVSPDLVLFEAPLKALAVTTHREQVPVRLGGSGKPKRSLKGPTVLAGHGPVGRGEGYQTNLPLSEICRLQGLPEDFLEDAPFTAHGKRRVVGNGVALPVGRAIARAVRRALDREEVSA